MALPSSHPAEIFHSRLGTVRDLREGGVIQFMGIKYAALEHWLDNPGAVDTEMIAIQKVLPKPEFPGLFGTDCLTLNITIPEDAHPSSLLPVLVYINGGGFTVDSNWWSQYDMKRIVQLSINLGQPIIGINIKQVSISPSLPPL